MFIGPQQGPTFERAPIACPMLASRRVRRKLRPSNANIMRVLWPNSERRTGGDQATLAVRFGPAGVGDEGLRVHDNVTGKPERCS
jgi:hypothetical protein